jgi:hypothetical protein
MMDKDKILSFLKDLQDNSHIATYHTERYLLAGILLELEELNKKGGGTDGKQ